MTDASVGAVNADDGVRGAEGGAAVFVACEARSLGAEGAVARGSVFLGRNVALISPIPTKKSS